jgi:TonB family protein
MGKQRLAFFLILVLLFPWRSTVGQGTSAPAGGAQGAYAESPDGLKSLVLDICTAKKTGDDRGLNTLLAGLVLPNHEAWMVATFGEPLGKRIAATYTERLDRLPALLSAAIKSLVDEGLTQVEVVTRDEPFVRLPGEGTAPAIILSKQRPTRLYDVRFQSADRQKTKSLWHFAFVDGGFRYIGTLKPAPADAGGGTAVPQPPSDVQSGGAPGSNAPPSPKATPQRIRMGGNMMQANLVKMVRPIYPDLVKQGRISGTVRLHVIVAKDGTIQRMEVISGHALLVQAALDAVRQWKYQPVLLNGEAVEVDTVVDVVFEINTKPPKKN